MDEFFNILETVGLHDCAKPHNAPFSKDGRIAFIDTQSYHEWSVNFKALTPYLSPANKAYWKMLIKKDQKDQKDLKDQKMGSTILNYPKCYPNFLVLLVL